MLNIEYQKKSLFKYPKTLLIIRNKLFEKKNLIQFLN